MHYIEDGAMDRPAIVRDVHLIYLDNLRESGQTNMFEAGPQIQEIFLVDRDQAKTILLYWMETFSKRHPKD